MDNSDLIFRLSDENPGFESLVFQLCNLVSLYPPPFIYINDTFNPRIASSVVDSILTALQPTSSQMRYARVNAVECFTARLFYDSVLNQLTGWEVKWDEGCQNWTAHGEKWNENLDAFCHGLKAVNAHLQSADTHMTGKASGKGKGKQKEDLVEADQLRMVIVIERAERLKETLPELLVPLTRLAELAEVEITTILISDVRWEDIRPSLGASPDPYYIDIPPPTKEATIKQLTAAFMAASASSTSASSSTSKSDAYHLSLLPLFSHFASMLYSICSPFTQDTHELLYISAARWSGFVRPLFDERQRKREDGSLDGDNDDEDGDMPPPSEETRIRLMRLFTPSFTAAMEALYPRLTNATDWAKKNMPEYDVLAKPPGYIANPRGDVGSATPAPHDEANAGMLALPRMSQFILVAAFLASTNPVKSDLRMFGRGLDEKKRKRRGGVKKKGGGKGGQAKIPQRLLGPMPFPLDRLIAILGVLLEENDVDTRLYAGEFTVPGEYTEMEIGRVQAYAAIMELTSMRLLHRTSALDKLDGPPMFKYGVSYDVALALARKLDVPLNDLMWEPA